MSVVWLTQDPDRSTEMEGSKRYRFVFDEAYPLPGEVLDPFEIEIEDVWARLLQSALENDKKADGGNELFTHLTRTAKFYDERAYTTPRGEMASLSRLTTATNLYWVASRLAEGAKLISIEEIK